MLDGPPTASLNGRRILVVEDDMLVFMLLEEFLLELGCKPVGPASRLAKAVELAASEAIDGAILDLNVAGEDVYPAAAKLRERGIPFAFVTGYASAYVSEAYRRQPVLRKPFAARELAQILAELFS